MPAVEQQPWSQELQQQLFEIRERYTIDRYPPDIETQHDYDYALHLLETGHFSRLHDIDRAERDQFDSDMRAESGNIDHLKTDDYRERLTELVESQADRIAWSSRTVGKTYADLDERFGFPNRGLYFGDGNATEFTRSDELTPPQAPTEQEQALAAWNRAQQPLTAPSESDTEHAASRNANYDGPDL